MKGGEYDGGNQEGSGKEGSDENHCQEDCEEEISTPYEPSHEGNAREMRRECPSWLLFRVFPFFLPALT